VGRGSRRGALFNEEGPPLPVPLLPWLGREGENTCASEVVKRSRSIHLWLIGTTAAGATLAGCGQRREDISRPISSENTYTNNQYVHGAGYYHAPFHGWFPFPYNHYVPNQGYYHGGQWAQQPHQSALTASRPTAQAAQFAQTQRAASQSASSTRRSGFGRSSDFISS